VVRLLFIAPARTICFWGTFLAALASEGRQRRYKGNKDHPACPWRALDHIKWILSLLDQAGGEIAGSHGHPSHLKPATVIETNRRTPF
jgi:hypothetical protein